MGGLHRQKCGALQVRSDQFPQQFRRAVMNPIRLCGKFAAAEKPVHPPQIIAYASLSSYPGVHLTGPLTGLKFVNEVVSAQIHSAFPKASSNFAPFACQQSSPLYSTSLRAR